MSKIIRSITFMVATFFIAALALKTVPVLAAVPGDIISPEVSVTYSAHGQAYEIFDVAPFQIDNTSNAGAAATNAIITAWGLDHDLNPQSAIAPLSTISAQSATATNVAFSTSQCINASNANINTSIQNVNGSTLALPGNYFRKQTQVFKIGEPLIIQIQDLDQNINSIIQETVVVTLKTSLSNQDTETLLLTESGVDTGIFIGIINTGRASTQTRNCYLTLEPGVKVFASYIDDNDSLDLAALNISFDPSNRVFDSFTGELLNNIEVTLINTDTGLPATVYGDDTVSIFPATIKSGNTIQDSSGKQYQFNKGEFRFPYLPTGNYRLTLANSVSYDFPSIRSEQVLQSLNNAPFSLSQASFNQDFVLTDNIFQIDLPIDPKGDRIMLNKTAQKAEAGIGDFVSFTINVRNAESAASGIVIVDQLPKGMELKDNTATLNGNAINVTQNNRELSFSLPDMTANENATIFYITQISPLANTNNQSIMENTAFARHSELKTNIAKAQVKLKDDFFNQNARIYGRVSLNDCQGNLASEGVEGVRLIMEDGQYVVTDRNGEWHIENVSAGTHVVQLDTSSLPSYLEAVACDNSFKHAGNANSQFVDLQPGTLWRANFSLKLKDAELGQVSQILNNHLLKRNGKELVFKDNKKVIINSPVKHKVRYQAVIKGNGTPLLNAVENIELPAGFYYEANSLMINGKLINDYNDATLAQENITIPLGDLPKHWEKTIEFNAIVSDISKKGLLKARAWMSFSTAINKQVTGHAVSQINLIIPPFKGVADPKEPLLFADLSDQLSEQDKQNLMPTVYMLQGLKELNLEITGHSDNRRISANTKSEFKNNQQLSFARAKMVGKFLAEKLDLPMQNINVVGMGAKQPIANNNTTEGRIKNRRVEVRVSTSVSEIAALPTITPAQMVATQSFSFNAQATAAGGNKNVIDTEEYFRLEIAPEINSSWFKKQTSNNDIVWPTTSVNLENPSTEVFIKHHKQYRVELMLNNEVVHPVYFRDILSSGQTSVSIWKGIELEEGNNLLQAKILNRSNQVIDTLNRNVHLASQAAKAELIEDLTITIADGTSTPVIAVHLLDKDGYPVRKGSKGKVSISSPYKQKESDEFDYNPLFNNTQNSYEVADNGIAFIKLQPTSHSGEINLTFDHLNGQQDIITTWVESQQHDWILVGLGDLTLGHNQVSGNKNNSSHIDNDIYHEGRIAFYAKGQVAGDWLLTAAYDSEKQEQTPFAKVINPKETYTLYGDASQQDLAASSGKKLFVKIERKRFYALFGDLSTGLNSTHLSRYVRNLTGIQVVYLGNYFEFSGFASDSELGFVRDEIQGNGTSGLYSLSKKFIVNASDKVVLQTRDRINPTIIIEEIELNRFTDYSIDYYSGNIYFKRPILSTDNSFNPVYIVASYETEQADSGHIIGGRAGIKTSDNNMKLGVTTIEQEQGENSALLKGVDGEITIGAWQAKVEVAQSEQTTATVKKQNDQAVRAEVAYRGKNLQIKADVSRVESQFGLAQQNVSEQDIAAAQIEGTFYPSNQDQIKVKLLQQETISTELDKQLAEASWNHKLSNTTAIDLGLLTSQEEQLSETLYVDEMSIGASWLTLEQKLKLSSAVIGNLSERSNSSDRIRLAAEYRWSTQLSSFAQYERSFDQSGLERTTMGLRSQPWLGATVNQSITQEQQDDGYRLYSVAGVNQDIKVSDHWLVSFGFDQSRNLEQAVPLETSQNSDDFYATNVGWGYRSKAWQWNNRIEHRNSEINKQWSGVTSLYHPLSKALATGGSFNLRAIEEDTGYNQTHDLTLDLAYRPQQSSLALLVQSRIVQNRERQSSNITESKKWVNNLHMNWMPTKRNQLAGQYGVKRILDQYNLENFNSLTDYFASQWRYNFTDTWDMGLHGRRLHQYDNKQSLYNTGASIGITPVKNFWASLGYNFNGFEDKDFSAANFTQKGVYLKLRFKFDPDTLKGMRQAFNF